MILADSLKPLLSKWFGTRILPFDEAAAVAYAKLVSAAQRRGCAIEVPDGQIAAVASEHGFAVATRDCATFLAMGLQVINPWEA